ncbi:hypothetical protein AAFF_G00094910 [Aldrovandia affinis]|uniref:Uncharacterized protein n=1 Tax=Aldrovandia affinis TaxID=143900 RepID=A0AAD7RVR0_9TELE|nr:hypothetical protein AAFF_G00094910 [Aldrovandia affinis]
MSCPPTVPLPLHHTSKLSVNSSQAPQKQQANGGVLPDIWLSGVRTNGLDGVLNDSQVSGFNAAHSQHFSHLGFPHSTGSIAPNPAVCL